MRRTAVLQGLRRIRFEDASGRRRKRRLRQAAAAGILRMSERTFRLHGPALPRRYRADGGPPVNVTCYRHRRDWPPGGQEYRRAATAA